MPLRPRPAALPDEALDALRARAAAPGPRIERMETAGRIVWIKRPGETQATRWHALQRLAARLAPHPMLRVTVDGGGPASIERERARIGAFRAAGFLVPEVLLDLPDALVLSDLGSNLGQVHKGDEPAFRRALPPLGETLGRVHDCGLVHGRPSRRDLVWHEGEIGFLDFEEDPLAAMPLTVAQARDVVLLFVDLARSGLDAEGLGAVWNAYAPHLSPERHEALRAVVGPAARIGAVFGPFLKPFAGRDLKAPIAAARFLGAALEGRRHGVEP